MMRNPKRLGAMAVVFGLALAIAAPVFAADEATVGYFIVQLAKAKQLNAADSEVAADSLAAVGIRLPSDLNLNGALTEGDVARLSRLAGVAVSTSRPEASFGRVQVERFFNSFGGELADESGATTRACDPAVENCDNPGSGDPDHTDKPFDPFSKGKGKKKGKAKGARTPSEPE